MDLAIAKFDGEGTAVLRYQAAKEASSGQARWTREVGFVEHHHSGRMLLRGTFAGHYLDVDENDRVSDVGTGTGAVAGGLVGALLGPAGIAFGLVVGGALGSHVNSGRVVEEEPQALAEQLREAVPPSSSALVLIAPPKDVTEMLTAVGESATGVVRESLTAEQEAQLQDALSAAPPVSPDA